MSRKGRSFEHVSAECEQWAEAAKKSDAITQKVTEAKQIDGLKWIMLEQNLMRTDTVQHIMDELQDIRTDIKQLEKLKFYHEKLNAAIDYVEQLLTKHRISTNQIKERATARPSVYTSAEIDQFLEQLRSTLKGHSIYPQMLISALEGLYQRRHFIRQKAIKLKPFDVYKQMAQQSFQLLKQELLEELQQKQRDHKLVYQRALETMEEEKAELHSLEQQAYADEAVHGHHSKRERRPFANRSKNT